MGFFQDAEFERIKPAPCLIRPADQPLEAGPKVEDKEQPVAVDPPIPKASYIVRPGVLHVKSKPAQTQPVDKPKEAPSDAGPSIEEPAKEPPVSAPSALPRPRYPGSGVYKAKPNAGFKLNP